jgi:hypothetical protein
MPHLRCQFFRNACVHAGLDICCLKCAGLEFLLTAWTSLESVEFRCMLRSLYIINLLREMMLALSKPTHPFWALAVQVARQAPGFKDKLDSLQTLVKDPSPPGRMHSRVTS